MRFELFGRFEERPCAFVHPRLFGQPVQLAVKLLQVGQDEFEVNDANVVGGIRPFADMNDILILKTAHDMHHRLGLADVAQKLVAQALPLRRAFDQPRNIHKFNSGVHNALGLDQRGESVQPLIGYGHNRFVGFDGAEGVVGRFGVLFFGEGVKGGAFAHVGQAHNANT